MDNSNTSDMDKYLAEREKLDSDFHDKFTRPVTVMFTDLKGSTSIAETEGDLVSRMLIKHVNDILLPAIAEHRGVFIKSIGDGSLSYFDQALDAVRAAVRIQAEIDALNMGHHFKFPVLVRVGMHTGNCIIEEHDIFGDVVNTASRFESTGSGGEIQISEETYNAVPSDSGIYMRFSKQIQLKGKKDAFNVYKVFWNPREIEIDLTAQPDGASQPVPVKSNAKKWAFIALAVLLALAAAGAMLWGGGRSVGEARHSIQDSVDAPGQPASR